MKNSKANFFINLVEKKEEKEKGKEEEKEEEEEEEKGEEEEEERLTDRYQADIERYREGMRGYTVEKKET